MSGLGLTWEEAQRTRVWVGGAPLPDDLGYVAYRAHYDSVLVPLIDARSRGGRSYQPPFPYPEEWRPAQERGAAS